MSGTWNWRQENRPRQLTWRLRSNALSHSRSAGIEPLEERRMLTVGVTASYAVSNDWGSGFQAAIQLTNQQATPVANWQLQFDFARNITSIWDATIVSHVGNHYVIGGASWDNTLAANSTLSFGFVGSRQRLGAAPANYAINSVPISPPSAPPPPTLSIADVSQNEGNSGTTNFLFTVTLSAPATSAVTVNYATANGTATAGSDYTAASGTLTFAPGKTSQVVTVGVKGDTTVEANETFSVALCSAVGATLARLTATGTIVNDDAPPASGNFQFQVTSDWGSGFGGQITATNSSQQPINNWQLEFDFRCQHHLDLECHDRQPCGQSLRDRQRRLEQHDRPRRLGVDRVQRQPRQRDDQPQQLFAARRHERHRRRLERQHEPRADAGGRHRAREPEPGDHDQRAGQRH